MKDQAARLRELTSFYQRDYQVSRPATMRIIAVTSGKGGVGKTNVVVNLAISLGQRGKRVIILDADLGMANVDVLMGLIPRCSLIDVVQGQKTVKEIMLRGPANVGLIPGGSGIQELANLEYYQRERLLQGLLGFEDEADFLLIDTGAGISKNVIGFVSAAHEVIVVITPEPTSITDAYGLIKILSRIKVHDKVNLVVNRIRTLTEAELAAEKVTSAASRFLKFKVEHLGSIAEDRSVGRAVMSQEPLMVAFPNSAAAKNLSEIAGALITGGQATSRGMGGFINRLTRLFS
ncbi:MAG: MinD/ParA family protein [Syntrophomonadaceae bacterium]|nr:MinD/ParA family protein [Syntrophomonadaceae bacterium]